MLLNATLMLLQSVCGCVRTYLMPPLRVSQCPFWATPVTKVWTRPCQPALLACWNVTFQPVKWETPKYEIGKYLYIKGCFFSVSSNVIISYRRWILKGQSTQIIKENTFPPVVSVHSGVEQSVKIWRIILCVCKHSNGLFSLFRFFFFRK